MTARFGEISRNLKCDTDLNRDCATKCCYSTFPWAMQATHPREEECVVQNQLNVECKYLEKHSICCCAEMAIYSAYKRVSPGDLQLFSQ